MPERFDAYHKWLGIPPKDQPPNHYRLLGIDLFEADPDVIEHAADQRMAHVRSFQGGKNAELSQGILNEIAAARVCLLDPSDKQAYDQQLNLQMTGTAPPRMGVPVALPLVSSLLDEEVAEADFDETIQPEPPLAVPARPISSLWQQVPNWQIAAAAGIVGAALLMAVALIVWGVVVARNRAVAQPGAGEGRATPREIAVPPKSGSGTSPPRRDVAATDEGDSGQTPPAGSTDSLTPSGEADAGSSNSGGGTPPDKESSEHPPDAAADTPHVPDNETAEGANGRGENALAASTGQRLARAPIPAADAQQKALQTFGTMLDDVSAKRIIELAQTVKSTPAARFALLARAKQTATQAGEVRVVLEVIDKMAAEYDVDPFESKAEALTGFSEAADGPVAFQEVCRGCLVVAHEATEQEDQSMAKEMAILALRAARKADDPMLANVATFEMLKLSETNGP